MDNPTFKEPDAMESLRELVQETQEQDDPQDSSGNLVISGLAMLVGAVVVAVAGWWLLKIGWRVHQELAPPHGTRRDEGNFGSMMLLAGAGALLGAAVLAVFALVSCAKVVMRRMGR